MSWGQNIGEPIAQNAPLLVSNITSHHLTTRAIQEAFKRTAAKAGLSTHYSIHCLRHIYACQLYKAIFLDATSKRGGLQASR